MLERQIEIRWRDIDGIRHVNNAVYLTYLEEARDAWLAGVFGEEADVTRYVIARIEIDYRSQLRHSDRSVVVTCALDSVGKRSFRTLERISNQEGEVAATAAAVLVAWDHERSRPLEEWEREALEREAARVA